ncbi:MAG: hypothetical protein NC328_02105 [Muribaculum sp.]|nr:hypothetical protein [Muribaculum sp.]
MKTIKQIKEVVPPGAVKLTPLRLNSFKLDHRHTLLTPEVLKEAALQQKGS